VLFVSILLTGAGLLVLGGTDYLAARVVDRAVDQAKRYIPGGSTHPLARTQFDRGVAPAGLRMDRMLLVLKRGPEREAALEKLLNEQLDPESPNFHKWVTPEQFGRRFGPSDKNIAVVTSWLKAHGFEVNRVSKGRTVVEFSGTARQVEEAFHTTIHKYIADGEQHWANASDPQIPAALATVVAGVDTLHDYPKRPLIHGIGSVSAFKSIAQQGVRPSMTFPTCAQAGFQSSRSCYGLGPYDFATIYNVLPLWNAGLNGFGQSIAILAASNINIEDVRNFRRVFGLPASDPVIILNGRDPGAINQPQPFEREAVTDVEWAGAVAPGATIRLIVSASTNSTSGFDLSAEYAVDNDVASILSGSYSFCESTLGAAGNQFHNRIWQQAAAQGITVVIGTGDGGSSDCDYERGGTPPAPARSGLAVNGVASTPYNVAVGGTDFGDLTNAEMYWSSINDSATHVSAKGYVPETTWNDSCTNGLFGTVGGFSSDAETNCNNRALSNFVLTAGGGGGKSACIVPGCAAGYPKPVWQTGPGVPGDGVRDIPDISLFSGGAVSGSFYLFCEADLQNGMPCSLGGANSLVQGAGGTSLSAPAFAGIMAIVVQNSNSRQGNPNPVLYKLASQQSPADCNATGTVSNSCIFHDVTAGTIAMPCLKASPSCVTVNGMHQYGILSGYDAGMGYDLATGLGSPNAFNLITATGWITKSQWIAGTDGTILFNVPDRGAASETTAGRSDSVNTGYARLETSVGSVASGMAILGFHSNGALVSEVSVPATRTMLSGRVYAEINGAVDTAIAIANPNSERAVISFFFTDPEGRDFGRGTFSVAANVQTSKFLSEPPFNGSLQARTFTFQASAPIAVTVLRGRTNENAALVMTALPVADLSFSTKAVANVPHFVEGGGWTTELLLVNPSDQAVSGSVKFVGTLSSSNTYSIAARSSIHLEPPSSATAIQSGWIQIAPDVDSPTPTGAAIFSFNSDGVTVTETSAGAVPANTAFQLYTEDSSNGMIRTGVAIMNPSDMSVDVSLESSNANGSPLATAAITVPAKGHRALFLNEVAGIAAPLRGIVRISAALPISAIGLRFSYNEKGDFLMTSLPPVAADLPNAGSVLFFPHLADGGGYTTQFILFGSTSSGTLQLLSPSGTLINPF